RTRKSISTVVRAEVERGEAPHGQSHEDRPEKDQLLRACFRDKTNNNRRHQDNHERARTKHQTRVGGAVTIERLEHLRDQNGAAKQDEEEAEVESVGQREVAFTE